MHSSWFWVLVFKSVRQLPIVYHHYTTDIKKQKKQRCPLHANWLTDLDSSKSPVCGMLGDAGWTWYAGPSHFGKGTHAENEMTREQGMCPTMLYLNSSSVTHSIPEMSIFTTANILLLISDKYIHSETSRNSSLCLVQPYSVYLQQPDPLPASSEDFCMCVMTWGSKTPP